MILLGRTTIIRLGLIQVGYGFLISTFGGYFDLFQWYAMVCNNEIRQILTSEECKLCLKIKKQQLKNFPRS